MAVIPGVTVDFTLSPRIITIPVAGVPVAVSIADLQDTLQDIEDNENDGICYPRLRDCSGGQALGGGRFAGYTMQLQNAQVMFEPQTTPESDGTATADDLDGTILTDSAATFVADGVERGHKVVNWTSGASSVVTEVISGTQLRHVALSGGSRSTWLSSDDYRVFPIVKCSVSAGNLTAVDGVGADLDPIMPSPNVFAEKESATSAALVEGSGGGTPGEVAEAVWTAEERTLTTTPPIGVLRNVPLPNFEFLMRDYGDHITPKKGLVVTACRSIDGSAFLPCANAVSEVDHGVYKINLAAADLNGDVITLRFFAMGADPTFLTLKTTP